MTEERILAVEFGPVSRKGAKAGRGAIRHED